MKTKNNLKGTLILLLTAFFWGTTFIAQRLGSDYIGPFAYCAIRFLISGVIMSIICILKKQYYKKHHITYQFVTETATLKKNNIYIYILLIGLSLFSGTVLQQIGLTMTKSASKSGFITSLYMLIVPIFSLILFKNKVRIKTWILLIIALIGSFLISYEGTTSFELGDILTFICAFGFALQITLIDKINPYVDSLFLSAMQFLLVGIISAILSLIVEKTTLAMLQQAIWAILYAAIFSGCIAYTFQIIGQKYTEPTIASIIMSLESVIAFICSVVILKEGLSTTGLIGAILIFSSVVLTQIKIKRKN